MSNFNWWEDYANYIKLCKNIVIDKLPTTGSKSTPVKSRCCGGHDVTRPAYLILRNLQKNDNTFYCQECHQHDMTIKSNTSTNTSQYEKYQVTADSELIEDDNKILWVSLLDKCKNYKVSEKGDVMNITSKKILKPEVTKDGYVRITLSMGNVGSLIKILVHRLVAICFLHDADRKYAVDHIDGNKLNNHYTNLRWMSSKENGRKMKTTIYNRGKSVQQINHKGEIFEYPSIKECAIKLDITENKLRVLIKSGKELNGCVYVLQSVEIQDELWIRFTKDKEIFIVSNMGRFKTKQDRITIGSKTKEGKYRTYNGYLVSRLVAEAFMGIPTDPSLIVNHINGDTFDNRATNLEWITNQENAIHAVTLETHSRSRRIYQLLDDKILAKYPSLRKASEITNIGEDNIGVCLSGASKSAGGFVWRYADKDDKFKEVWFDDDIKEPDVMAKPTRYNPSQKTILQYKWNGNVKGELVGTYESIADASRQTQVSESVIRRAVKGESKNKLYYWEYM